MRVCAYLHMYMYVHTHTWAHEQSINDGANICDGQSNWINHGISVTSETPPSGEFDFSERIR